MDTTVETATMDDVDRVTEQWVALASEQHDHGSHLRAEPNRDVIRSSMAHHVVTGTLLVARRDDCCVGFVSFEVEDGGLSIGVTRGRIQNLFVEPEHRGNGIGSRLLDRAESALNAEGVDAIAVEAMAANERARQLYRRRGYETHRVTFERPAKSDTHSREDG